MRKRLLAAASSVAFIMSGAAWAGQPTAEKTEMKSEAASEVKAPDTANGAMTTTTQTSAEMDKDSTRFGSYKDNPEAFSGEIAGGYSADDLIGRSLVDAKGDSVGEIDDLLVDASNQIDKAVVDVGGFLGIGEHRVALDIDKLKMSDDKAFVADMTQEELEALPAYKRSESFWDQVTK